MKFFRGRMLVGLVVKKKTLKIVGEIEKQRKRAEERKKRVKRGKKKEEEEKKKANEESKKADEEEKNKVEEKKKVLKEKPIRTTSEAVKFDMVGKSLKVEAHAWVLVVLPPINDNVATANYPELCHQDEYKAGQAWTVTMENQKLE
ncbi:hypothetical protein L1987_87463 [Smallanthus sonchifolius]|nr:hypothetical protein L1987_87463 [Smallanthus sonchifolius]